MKMLQRQMPALVLVLLVGLALTGCPKPVVLEAGGPYSDPVLYQTDRAILDAKHGLLDFTAWVDTNNAFLTANAPQAVMLASQIKANLDTWEKTAFTLRTAYASSLKAYADAVAASKANNTPAPDGTVVTTAHDKLQGAVAVLENLLPLIAQYRSTIVIKTS